MRSPDGAVRALWQKELRELFGSPAFALLLVGAGLLVGQSFIAAVESYSELSAGALPQGMSPLDGILVPTFGAYDLAATLLLPFVVIRCFGSERASGAWSLLLQSRVSVRAMVALKAGALMLGWIIALVPGMIALALWGLYGGHLNLGELGVLLVGHLLRAGVTVGIAAVMAAVASQPATAAIATLGATVGLWAVDFIAATKGGIAERIAAFGPAHALRQFEQGLLRADIVLVQLVVIAVGLALAAHGLAAPGSRRTRIAATARVAALGLVAIAGASMLRVSADLSEDRRHSLSPETAAALRTLPEGLLIEAHLAPEDPRLADLERGVLHRIERVLPGMRVERRGGAGTGLFAHPDSAYGEIWYSLGGRRVLERSTIDAVVLETILRLGGIEPPAERAANAYTGYPLATQPRFALLIFYFAWPATVWLLFRRGRSAK